MINDPTLENSRPDGFYYSNPLTRKGPFITRSKDSRGVESNQDRCIHSIVYPNGIIHLVLDDEKEKALNDLCKHFYVPQVLKADEFEVGKFYYLISKQTGEQTIEQCKLKGSWKYFGQEIWSYETHSRFYVHGPVPMYHGTSLKEE